MEVTIFATIAFFSIELGFLWACPTHINPCLVGYYEELPNQSDRCPGCGVGSQCDKYGMLDDTWYRFDYVITMTHVDAEACGTVYPIWMNGTFPDEADATVDRVGCLSTHSNMCEQEFNLMVRNCSSHYVYCMKKLPTSCPQRLCFDSPPLTTTTTTTTTTTATTPIATTSSEKNSGNDCSDEIILAVLLSIVISALVFCVVPVGVILHLRSTYKLSPFQGSEREEKYKLGSPGNPADYKEGF